MSETKDQGYQAKAVDTTNISDWDPQVFADMVDTAARANYVMRDVAAQVNRQLVGSPGSSIDIRERGTASASSLSENASASSNADTDPTHSKVNVSVSKIAASTYITREAEEDALGDQMDGVAEEHGEALAKKNDADAYSTVEGASGTNTVTVGTDGELAYSDVKDAMVAILADDYDPDTLVIHPDFLGDLLGEQKFIDASQFGGDEPIREGRIASFIGLDVYLTTQANASSTSSGATQAIVLDSDRAFVEAVKREPTTEMEFQEDNDRWQLVSTMRYGHSVLNANAICHLNNA